MRYFVMSVINVVVGRFGAGGSIPRREKPDGMDAQEKRYGAG